MKKVLILVEPDGRQPAGQDPGFVVLVILTRECDILFTIRISPAEDQLLLLQARGSIPLCASSQIREPGG